MTSFQMGPKGIRLVELVLVLGVAFAGSIVTSLYSVAKGSLNLDPQVSFLGLLNGLVYELLALGVLAYVLFRQGRSFQDIGLTFAWKDIPRSLLVAFVGYVAYMGCYLAIYYGASMLRGGPVYQSRDSDAFLQMGVTVETVLFVLVNPFFEELIVRAYTMSELTVLTSSETVAVVGSVFLQSLYHLYQGLSAAIAGSALFLVFALYYRRSKRIAPIVLAHMYFDVLVLLVRAR